MESSTKSQNEEHKKAVDDLYRQLKEVKGQLQASEGTSSKLQANLDEKIEKLSSSSLKIQELENTVSAKV